VGLIQGNTWKFALKMVTVICRSFGLVID